MFTVPVLLFRKKLDTRKLVHGEELNFPDTVTQGVSPLPMVTTRPFRVDYTQWRWRESNRVQEFDQKHTTSIVGLLFFRSPAPTDRVMGSQPAFILCVAHRVNQLASRIDYAHSLALGKAKGGRERD